MDLFLVHFYILSALLHIRCCHNSLIDAEEKAPYLKQVVQSASTATAANS